MKEYKKKIISLDGNRKLINACNKAELKTFNPRGEWNGYGYTKLPMAVEITSLGDMRKFNKIKKELEEKPVPARKTEEDKTASWARRLVRLTGIEYEDAIELAKEKLEYKDKEIEKLEDRQHEHYSEKREKLIRELYRSNPLRYIKDGAHAENILAASRRHNYTDYDTKLEYIHEMESFGIVPKGNAKELARTHTMQELIQMEHEPWHVTD